MSPDLFAVLLARLPSPRSMSQLRVVMAAPAALSRRSLVGRSGGWFFAATRSSSMVVACPTIPVASKDDDHEASQQPCAHSGAPVMIKCQKHVSCAMVLSRSRSRWPAQPVGAGAAKFMRCWATSCGCGAVEGPRDRTSAVPQDIRQHPPPQEGPSQHIAQQLASARHAARRQ